MPTEKLCALGLACVLTVEPVVRESEEAFDPRLVGTWEEHSGFARSRDRAGRGGQLRYLRHEPQEDHGIRGPWDASEVA